MTDNRYPDTRDPTARVATRGDIAAVDALLARSYPALLKHDYPPSVLVTALPLISRAQPALVTCGSYFVVETADGAIVAAGGWTAQAPRGAEQGVGIAHVRHVVTDHRHVRRGIGRLLMAHVLDTARAAGHRHMLCQSTLTAVRFYAAMGFADLGRIDVPLRAGISFAAVRMARDL